MMLSHHWPGLGFGVFFDGDATADEVAVAVDVVDAGDGAPVFVDTGCAFGEAAFFAGVLASEQFAKRSRTNI